MKPATTEDLRLHYVSLLSIYHHLSLPQKLVTRQPLTKTDTTPALKTDETTTTTVATTVTTLKSADGSTTETAVTDSTTQSGGVAPGR